MKVSVCLTKSEFDIVRRGISSVLVEENAKSGRRRAGWKATRAYLVAEELEKKLLQIQDQMKEMMR
jgi:hypothetical protein